MHSAHVVHGSHPLHSAWLSRSHALHSAWLSRSHALHSAWPGPTLACIAAMGELVRSSASSAACLRRIVSIRVGVKSGDCGLKSGRLTPHVEAGP